MNILLLPDSFKDSLSAGEVAACMEKGIRKVIPDAQVFRLSVSDGGEGFLEAVQNFIPGIRVVTVATRDPLGRAQEADFLLNEFTGSAYIELAKASGLELLIPSERNPMMTSTYGTGIQIKEALEMGARKIYVGLGGSATNDGGTGIAEALGYIFTDDKGKPVQMRGGSLNTLERINTIEFDKNVEVFAINDVLNPLTGPKGAAHTYARQKGASDAEIHHLDSGLVHLAEICAKTFGYDHRNVPGAGAAGGTAYGLKTFLHAEFISGVAFILNLARFKELVTENDIDLIITGEGKIDDQTAYGKMVSGVAKEALPYNIPVVAICGKLDLDKSGIESLNLKEVRQLYDSSKPPGYSFENAARLIEERTSELISSTLQL